MNHTLLAQIKNPVLPPVIGNNQSQNPGGNALGKLIGNLVGALFIAGFLLAFVYLVMGGITWITAGGDKTKLEKARDEITNSILGIIVVGAAWAMAVLVASFFGLDMTSLSFPAITGY